MNVHTNHYHPRHKLKPKAKKHFRNFVFFVFGLIIIATGLGIIWLANFKLPDFRAFDERKVVNSTKIYDKTGTILLYDVHEDIRRTNIPFEEMGSNIKNATVAIEDAEFYNHKGIRVTSIIRAILFNFTNTSGGTQGGSTITQQLVKNSLLNNKKTITRKIQEWILAMQVDKSLPKEKILEYYLNESPYGGNIYGIEEASRTFFEKKSQDLTIAESAYLAAIPQSPTTLSPYGKNKDKLDDRKNLVLKRMFEVGFLTEEEYKKAKEEEVLFVPKQTNNIKAPHFVFFIKEYLENKYSKQVLDEGVKVTTTLDWKLQEKAEAIVKEGALQNAKDWNGNNASLVAIDPKTGQILTMVGSRDYFDKEIDGNFNVSTAKRQPGSSFKPFIYATAFNKGFTPSTVVFDLFTEFSGSCNAYGQPLPGRSSSSCYNPQNYDGKYRGPITLKNALAQSVNIPAVKLFYLAGMRDSLKTAEDMGINTLTDISRYGLTLVIGGGEVTLLDITSAYGVFANNGVRNPYTGILKIEKSNGEVLEEFTPKPREVIPRNTALSISNILSDNQARTPTFGANSQLVIPGREVAAKTGTTNNNKDAWTVGYSPSVVVGVWSGNNDNTSMKKGGVAMAGPIWNKFIKEALKDTPSENFEKPDWNLDPKSTKPVLRGNWQGNENFFIDKISGKLATENTPQETLQEKVLTNVHSILYWVDINDIKGPAPTNPESDSQFNSWETSVRNWWVKNSFNYPATYANEKPITYDNIHTEENKPKINLLIPNEYDAYNPDQKIQLKFENYGPFPLEKMEIFINDIFMGSVKSPFVFSFIPRELENLSNVNTIKIISYDNVYNRGESYTRFSIIQP
ncbi:MAG: PBP1A family penicillin-binding protein [Candidatus Pacebacteria bacterium]|nr:PBP1A family penicillin-binding protein [Candidatus Paceibacterota bacterium]MCF7862411.1 PBP1A family penicillin-binding protein [Candidatus Paceibacterota bacterium]